MRKIYFSCSVVLMTLALLTLPGKSNGQSDEAKMAMPIPPQVTLPDNAPDVSAILANSYARGVETDGCYIPHDPATWTEPSFVNGGSGGDNQDDGSSAIINLPFSFDLYGSAYTSLYININGNVSFGTPYWQYTSTGFPSDDYIMIAPFWGDVDLGGVGEIWYIIDGNSIMINWVGVGYYNEQTNLVNTFQLILTDGTDPLIGLGNNIAFYYDDMQWTTGSASGGSGGFGGTPATVGINSGNGIDFIQIGRFNHAGTDYDGPGGNHDGVDYLDGQCLEFNGGTDDNIAPIADGFPSGIITICNGETATISGGFLAPELAQTASVVVTSASPGLSVVTNTPGNPAIVQVTFTGSDLNTGLNIIEFDATDNAAVPLTTHIEVQVYVTPCACQCPGNFTTNGFGDNEPPVASEDPQDIYVECGDAWQPADITFTDNCDDQPDLFPDVFITMEACTTTYHYTWLAIDDCENTTAVEQYVYITDNTPPVLVMPEPDFVNTTCDVVSLQDVEAYLGGYMNEAEEAAFEAAAVAFFQANNLLPLGATDNCDQDPEVTEIGLLITGPSDLDCPNVAMIECVFQAVDNCGNLSETASTFIHILDETSPVFPDQQAVYNLGCNDQVPYIEPLVAEGCSGEVELTYTDSDNCDQEGDCDFTTYTIGGWGAPANGNNPGVYRDANFAAAFPGGLTVGCAAGFEFLLTTAAAVEAYLPGGGNPQVLGADLVDPGNAYNNTFASQLIAVELALGFDAYDPNFGGSAGFLGDAVIASGDFAGWTISQLAAAANDVLGGCSNAYSVASLNEALSAINENFDAGANGGYTICEEGASECFCSVIRVWTATDGCGNSASFTQYFNLGDTEAPIPSAEPEDLELECGSAIPPAPAVDWTDECSENLETWFFEDLIIFNECHYRVVRVWYATDGCHTASVDQVIDVEDTTPPVVAGDEELDLECGEENDIAGISVSDACDDNPTIEYTDSEIAEDGCSYEFTRTFTVSDNCGNETIFVQHIVVGDSQGPQIFNVEEEISVQCADDIPPVAEAYAIDNCSGEEEVLTFTSETGDVIAICDLATAIGPGPDWSLWLPVLAADNQVTTNAFVFDANGGTFVQYGDGTAHLYGTLVNNTNANEQFVANLWFENAADWATWSALGRSYKDDLGCAQPDLFEAWTYYEMVNDISTLTGAGDLAGSILFLHHMPHNYYYGFQIGQGANNKNCNYGLSGWFTYHGFVDCQEVSGHGDVNVDAECEEVFDEDCENNTVFTHIYQAVDDSGNVTVVEQTVTVEDTTPPAFDNCPEDVAVQCPADVPAVAQGLTATDNCDDDVEVVYVGEETEGEFPCDYTITRTWFAEDDCENRTFCIQHIHVHDTTAPVFGNVPALISIECSDDIPAPAATAADNCSAVEIGVNEAVYGDNCYGMIVRVYTATDECGNASSFTQTIEIHDTTEPEFDPFEGTIYVECDELDTVEELTATDNCDDDVVVTYNETLVSGGCLGGYFRVYTATDDCGNSTTVNQYVSIIDTTPPVIDCPAEITAECDEVPSVEELGTTATDNCGQEVELTYTTAVEAGGCPQEYDIIITYTAVDICENTSTCVTVIHVVDTSAPVFTYAPETAIYECDEPIIFENASADDNCGQVTITHIDEDVPGDCPQEFHIIRTFYAEDECGNVATAVQHIYIVDTTAPEFTGGTEYISAECDETIPYLEPTATDNCGSVTISYYDIVAYESSCYTLIYRIFLAEDECGNVEEFEQVIEIVDTTAPVITGEVEIELPCDDYEGVYITATDNCQGDGIYFDYTDEHVSGGCAGRIIRTYLVSDYCGNETTFVQIITLTDEVPPVASFDPQDFTIECGQFYDLLVATFTDNCDEVLELDFDLVESGDDCIHYITYTWSATDHCDNTTSVSQTVTVIDTTAPVWNSEGYEITVNCYDELPVQQPTAADLCNELEITYDFDVLPGECPNEWTEVYTWLATDLCGNESLPLYYIIHYVDNDVPEFDENSQSYFEVECDDELPYVEPAVYDLCGNVELDYVDNVISGSDCYGIIYRIWTATDECGNFSSFYQAFSIYDDTDPVFDAFDVDILLPCDNYAGIYVTATDNCDDDVYITYTDAHVSGGCIGKIIRTYYAYDNCENVATAEQIITLTDAVPPVASFDPQDFAIECGQYYDLIIPTFTDNCDEELDLGFDIEEGGDACAHTYTYTWSATDGCGNTTSVSQTVTITDTQAPLFDAGDYETTVLCNTEVSFETPTATDVCDDDVTVDISLQSVPGNCPNEHTDIYTFVATDDCGNQSSIHYIIHYIDDVDPHFTYVPAGGYFGCDETLPQNEATAADNCGDAEVTSVVATWPGECPNEYAIVITWTATDACGNTATELTVYNVYDNTPPVFDADVDDVVVECAGDVPAIPTLTATDNCGAATVSHDIEFEYADECGNTYYTVIYTAADACGNLAYRSYSVSVYDNTDPVLSDTPADIVLDCEDAVPDAAVLTATDNCDEDVIVEYDEEFYGDVPEPGSEGYCNLMNPAFAAVDTDCNYPVNWAMIMFNVPAMYKYYQLVDGEFNDNGDGTATITATVVSTSNPGAGFYINILLENGMDWPTFDSQPYYTNYKSDCVDAGDNYLDWMYYFLSNTSTLTGWGDFTGSFINLSHAPSNHAFAYQVGLGANNQNENFGSGGWFNHSGVITDASNQNTFTVNGAGDLAFEHDCCPDYYIVRTWCATDCTGNTTCWSQTISFEDLTPFAPGNNDSHANEKPVSGDFEIVTVHPNPAKDMALISFTSAFNNTLTMDVYDMAGRKVDQLFHGSVKSGETVNVSFDTQMLEDGIYNVRLFSLNDLKVKRIIVER